MAIDWSTRVKRGRGIRDRARPAPSFRRRRRCGSSIKRSRPDRPLMVSAESITASVPSSTRWRRRTPGAGGHRRDHDSIICAAVMVSCCVRAPRIMFLQRRHRGVADLDRQIVARHHDAVTGRHDPPAHADRLGALDLGDQKGLRRRRAIAAPCTCRLDLYHTARKSTLIMAACGCRPCPGGDASGQPPRRLMPLLFDNTPPWCTRQ